MGAEPLAGLQENHEAGQIEVRRNMPNFPAGTNVPALSSSTLYFQNAGSSKTRSETVQMHNHVCRFKIAPAGCRVRILELAEDP